MRSISPEQWRRIEPLLEKVLDLPDKERTRFLDRECTDPNLRSEIEALLESEALAGDLLTGGIAELMPTLAEEVRREGRVRRLDEAGPEPESRYLPGTLLERRYRVVSLLGRGGMGEVYRADDLKLGEAVALKFLPGAIERRGGLDRFLSEVKLARQIAHPNVARVYDVGETDGQHFLSMEYVDGEDLASLLRRIGRLPREKAMEIGRQLASGLAAAHEEGILHRDLKPANVMIDGRGRVKITDFGLAVVATEAKQEESLTGTPAYMAPEQLSGELVTERSDLYALGLVLYELVTGRRPHQADSLEDLRRSRSTLVATRPSSHVEGLDPAVEKAIESCLEPDPARRPDSARAVAAAFSGGDPLAAALAAGETPSPEMVAASVASEGLRPAVALGCLAVLLAALVWIAASASDVALISRVPWEASPAELENRAVEVLELTGWNAPAKDVADGFRMDPRFRRRSWTAEEERLPWRDPATARPSPAAYWYRQSPRSLVPFGPTTRTRRADPPFETPGEAIVDLDTRNRLVGFRVVSTEFDAGLSPTEPDWSVFFALTDVDPSSVLPVAPGSRPTIRSDRELAWTARLAEQPKVEVRIEAASYRGRPVYFELVPPWTPEEELARQGVGEMPPAVGALMLTAVFISVPLARRNIRLGRADRRGAFRLAVFGVSMGVLVWTLTAHHVASGLQVRQTFMGLVFVSFLGGVIPWLLYLAVEPFIRRLWPNCLTSWSRLLDGRLRDPVVGRHLLLGGLFGALLAASRAPLATLMQRLGGPVEFLSWRSAKIDIGATEVCASFASMLPLSVRIVFMGTVLFLLFRLLLGPRRALAAFAALILVLGWAAGPTGSFLRADLLLGGLEMILFAVLLVRLGVLAAVSAHLYGGIGMFVLTNDPSSWLAGQTLLTLALYGGLAVYATYISLGGRSVLDWQALEESRR